MLNAAISISDTGRYTMSRPPGHPVPEYVYSLFTADPVPLLSLVALIGAVGIAFFALSARRLGCRDAWLAAAAVAMTPVVIINGTNLMDYTWEFAFLMAAFYFVLRGRPTVGGVLTGIAVGSRVTAGVMLIPFSILLLFERRPVNRHAILGTARMWVACVLTCVLCYLPVIFEYGTNAFRAVDERRPIVQVIETAGVEFWGSVGLFAIAVALGTLAVLALANRRMSTSIPETLPRHHEWSWLAVLALYAAAFIRLPHEAGYLIPVVPFVVLLFARHLPRWGFVVFCVLLAASPFVDVGGEGVKRGPFSERVNARQLYNRETELIVIAVKRLPQKDNIVVAGWIAPQLQTLWYYQSRGDSDRTVFEKEMPDSVLTRHIGSGRKVYALPDPGYYRDQAELRRLADLGADPIFYKGIPTETAPDL
jgi:hypothetical protein